MKHLMYKVSALCGCALPHIVTVSVAERSNKVHSLRLRLIPSTAVVGSESKHLFCPPNTSQDVAHLVVGQCTLIRYAYANVTKSVEPITCVLRFKMKKKVVHHNI